MVEIRDRLVAIVLAAGLLLGMAGWQAVGPWLGLAVAVLAVVCASSVYRIDRPGRAAAQDDPPPCTEQVVETVEPRRRVGP